MKGREEEERICEKQANSDLDILIPQNPITLLEFSTSQGQRRGESVQGYDWGGFRVRDKAMGVPRDEDARLVEEEVVEVLAAREVLAIGEGVHCKGKM